MTSSLMRGSAHSEPDYRESDDARGIVSHDVFDHLKSTNNLSSELDSIPNTETSDDASRVNPAIASTATFRGSDEHVPRPVDLGHDKFGVGNQQYAAVTVADAEYHQNHQEVPMKAFDSNHADFSHAGDVDELLQQQQPVNLTANVGNNFHPAAPALPDAGLANAVPAAGSAVDHLAAAGPQPQDLPGVGDVAGALPQPHGLPGAGEVASALPQPQDLDGVGEVAGALPDPHGLPGVNEVAGSLPQPHGLPTVGHVAGALSHGLPGVGEVPGSLPQPQDLPGVEGL